MGLEVLALEITGRSAVSVGEAMLTAVCLLLTSLPQILLLHSPLATTSWTSTATTTGGTTQPLHRIGGATSEPPSLGWAGQLTSPHQHSFFLFFDSSGVCALWKYIASMYACWIHLLCTVVLKFMCLVLRNLTCVLLTNVRVYAAYKAVSGTFYLINILLYCYGDCFLNVSLLHVWQ